MSTTVYLMSTRHDKNGLALDTSPLRHTPALATAISTQSGWRHRRSGPAPHPSRLRRWLPCGRMRICQNDAGPHLPCRALELSRRCRMCSLRTHHHPIIVPRTGAQTENRRDLHQRLPGRQESRRVERPAPVPLPHPTRGVRRAGSGSHTGTARFGVRPASDWTHGGDGVLPLGFGMVASQLLGRSVEVDASAQSARCA